MNPGFVRCPLCARPVKLWKNGYMAVHYASFYKAGAGIQGVSQKCDGSNKKPEALG